MCKIALLSAEYAINRSITKFHGIYRNIVSGTGVWCHFQSWYVSSREWWLLEIFPKLLKYCLLKNWIDVARLVMMRVAVSTYVTSKFPYHIATNSCNNGDMMMSHIERLMQGKRRSSALAMGLCLSCNNQSIYELSANNQMPEQNGHYLANDTFKALF